MEVSGGFSTKGCVVVNGLDEDILTLNSVSTKLPLYWLGFKAQPGVTIDIRTNQLNMTTPNTLYTMTIDKVPTLATLPYDIFHEIFKVVRSFFPFCLDLLTQGCTPWKLDSQTTTDVSGVEFLIVQFLLPSPKGLGDN